MNTPPSLPGQSVTQPKKKKGCSGCVLPLGIGFAIFVIFAIFVDGPADKWEDQKGELLPQIKSDLEAGNFEDVLSRTDEFEGVEDESLQQIRNNAKSRLAELEREKEAVERAERLATLKEELRTTEGDKRWEVIAAIKQLDPGSEDLAKEFAELESRQEVQREQMEKERAEKETIRVAEMERENLRRAEIERKKNAPTNITWKEISAIYSLKSKVTDLKKDIEWEKYKGKKIRWTGEVASIDKLFGSLLMQVKLNPETFTSDVIIDLEESEFEKAAEFSEGDKVTFEGILQSWGTLTDIRINRGVIVE